MSSVGTMQIEIYNKLKELNCIDYRSGLTAIELANEFKGTKELVSLYRNLRDLLKNKRINKLGKPARYWICN